MMPVETDRFIALLDPSLVNLRVRAEDDKDAIRKVGGPLLEQGRVSDGFIDEVVSREAEFPTGLPTSGIKVALPHTGSTNVISSAIAIGILDTPVPFRTMGAPDQWLAVQVIFLLALRERDSQPQILKSVVQLIQNPGLLEQILAASSAAEVYQAICSALAA